MSIFKHAEFGPPCPHMKGMLNGAADGTATGLALWYARNHASRCNRCGRYLETLEGMIEELHGAGEAEIPDDVRERLSQAIRDADALV